ncbi:hypothetical protein DM860_008851 [Cuscuta australis]|uniref:Acetyltransferase n=1 Tax=Cuscuta australis TaxID=267555 RepID=A0A328DBD6_9ASTE|nr:hypothetical protein DM860_008851 [Cuscuta australis]
MAEVVVISTSLVGAPSPASGERSGVSRMDLTPWDLQFLQVATIQKGLLFHKPNPQQQQEQSRLFSSTPKLIHHLKTSLSSALSFYPPAAGRFAAETDEENHTSTLHVDCNNAGVEFVQAKAAGVTVAAILDPTNPDVSQILRSFFPLNGVLNADGIAKPLMGVQVTELHDGYFIACTLNHALADGTSFWNFFRSWSEISRRGCPQISKPPSLKRWFSGSIPCPIPLPPRKEFQSEIFSLSSPRTETMFRLSKENIAKLKEKANSEVMVTTTAAPIISSLMSYMAHLWRSVTRARNLEAQEEVHIMIIVGARQRMNLPEGYWGNAVVFETVTAKAGEGLGEGLGWAALQMKRGVQKYTEQEMMNQYVGWAKSPNFVGEEGLPANVLAISSSPRFDVYGTDFGWGRPVAVRSGGGNKHDGKTTLFAGREEGSVEIELCLHPNTLIRLRNDPEFLEYVTF